MASETNTTLWMTLEDLDGEVWKEIPHYEGFYEASNMGRIKSKERHVGNYYVRESIVMQYVKQRYFYVNLSKAGQHKTLRVHRLIALAFLPNPDNLPEVNHKDENTLNNRIENLEWCNKSYNLDYGTRIERARDTRRCAKPKKIVHVNANSDVKCLDNEEWRPVVGYEGLYEISNLGRVKSLHRRTPFIVRTKTNTHGRIIANLHHKGEVHSFGVHVLIAKAFIPNPDNLPEVNHKDENPANNIVENLEWCTHEYNMHYGTLYKRLSSTLQNNSSMSRPVVQYDLEGKFVRVWPSIREVKRSLNEKGWKTICDVCKGKAHSAMGFQWRYVEGGKTPAEDIGPIRRRCSTAPKAVYQYTLEKLFVRKYESVTAASASVGIPGTNISACINGKQKTAAGFLWFDKMLNP